MRTILLTILLALPLFAPAQNFEQDAKKIRDAYAKITKLDAELQVNVYENSSSVKPVETKTVSLKKSQEQYLYRMEGVIMLMNDKCRLMINTSDKQMLYSKRDIKEEKAMLKEFAPEINELVSKNDSITYAGIEGGSKHYIIYTNDKMIQRTDLYFDPGTGLINKLVYYYNTELFPAGNKVVINYKKFNTGASFSQEVFSESKYVQGPPKKMKPSTAYDGYHLLVYDDKEWDKF